MKRLSSTFILVFLMLGFTAKAQLCDTTRYKDAIFNVSRTDDIVYGNAQAIPAVYVSENITVAQDLKLDLFMPIGDTLAKRPLLMFAFGGGFLIGSKEDEDARALCDSFARKGFVTASINYRLGMNISSAISGERAVYRAVQDWSAAIRYFKEYADSFRIDTSWIFAGGVSAGSISAMHCQYASESERPFSSFAQTFPFTAPDLGCKDCSGNSFAHSSQARALINCWGAIGDTAWIEPSDNVPMISFHGDLDPVVPYGFGLPFTALFTMPPVYGSSLIHARQDNIGIDNAFTPYLGEGHNVWGTIVSNSFVPGPTQHWAPILDSIETFLWKILEPTTGPISGIGFSYPSNLETYTVNHQAGYHWCWEVSGGNIVSSNPSSDTIVVEWITPGLGSVKCQAVSHLGAVADASELPVVVGLVGTEVESTPALFKISNLADQHSVEIGSAVKGNFKLKVMNLQGIVVWEEELNAAQNREISLPSSAWPAGIYFLALQSKRDNMVQRFVNTH